ncbi:unnamed protein product [Dimorphilus gyrociliatus]|uniref:Methylcytosine dioxygenase TET n=1 Tax=Dimorphilus gyrociliatus TaxID=2664684 RepID=A0A7I8WD00_9ANNE|nr:unnamed protein product [Dimorphilus gyrociliatus]
MSFIRNASIPPCDCNINTELLEGNIYFHLGHGKNEEDLSEIFEERKARLIPVYYKKYVGVDGKGCPKALEVLSKNENESDHEQLLILYRKRPYHTCKYSLFIIAIVQWENEFSYYDQKLLFGMLCANMCNSKLERPRACTWNRSRTCSCQGVFEKFKGRSYTVGCSYSPYLEGCGFAQAQNRDMKKYGNLPREVAQLINECAKDVAEIQKDLVPKCFANMVKLNNNCRIGFGSERPYSTVNINMDYSAHTHQDFWNMDEGCSVIYTLVPLKRKPEQLHILSHYSTTPGGSVGGLGLELTNGSVLIEYSKYETHATTALTKPNSLLPKRLSLTFYQQRDLNEINHGYSAERAQRMRQQRQRKQRENQQGDLDRGFLMDEKSTFIDAILKQEQDPN